MLRKNPRGDYPVVHESSFIDPTAIPCGQLIVGENVFIGPYAVLRADEVDGRDIPENFHIPSTTNISRETDLATILKVTVDAHEFSGSVSRTNVELARAYRRIQNEF